MKAISLVPRPSLRGQLRQEWSGARLRGRIGHLHPGFSFSHLSLATCFSDALFMRCFGLCRGCIIIRKIFNICVRVRCSASALVHARTPRWPPCVFLDSAGTEGRQLKKLIRGWRSNFGARPCLAHLPRSSQVYSRPVQVPAGWGIVRAPAVLLAVGTLQFRRRPSGG